jgi:hypothetical protein
MPELQDKLLKIYRRYYLTCLERVRHHLQTSEPKLFASKLFVCLRDKLGHRGKAEKFLIGFHAGLMRHQKRLKPSDFRSLPSDVRDLITDHWLQLCSRPGKTATSRTSITTG